MITDESFEACEKADVVEIPKAAGTRPSMSVHELETDFVYFFALRTIDGGGRISGLSENVNEYAKAKFSNDEAKWKPWARRICDMLKDSDYE